MYFLRGLQNCLANIFGTFVFSINFSAWILAENTGIKYNKTPEFFEPNNPGLSPPPLINYVNLGILFNLFLLSFFVKYGLE